MAAISMAQAAMTWCCICQLVPFWWTVVSVIRLPRWSRTGKILVLEGGDGGKGNSMFKSSTNQAPREFTLGKMGDGGDFKLIIKTIADVGLIGFPNAGKSTLLNMLTNAHPKTGAYPFTTMFPTVGVLEFPEQYERVTLADIPPD